MAAALVPLAISALPSIIELIAGLVHKAAPAAEADLGSGTGPVKFAQVFQAVIGSLTKAAAAGQIDKSLPNDEIIKVIIQAVVSSMKLEGMLSGVPAAPVASSQALTLTAGQSVTITVR